MRKKIRPETRATDCFVERPPLGNRLEMAYLRIGQLAANDHVRG